jgi:hypothetical protein
MDPIIITIGNIFFEAGNLSRPRYPHFYRYPKPPTPALQLEPAFQVDDEVKELSVQLDLAIEKPDVQVEFVDDRDDPGKPLCRELNDSGLEQPQVEYFGSSKTSCVLTWKAVEGAPKTRVFRLYCQRQQGKDLTDEEKVYGGLFLTFTTDPTGQIGKEIEPTKFPDLRPGSVWLLGSNVSHSPLYDQHHPLAMPEGVEIEPAFRIREGHQLNFGMVQGIDYASWLPQLKFLQPPEKPDALDFTHTSTYYSFSWRSAPRDCQTGIADCYEGQVVTFHLQPILPETHANFVGALLEAGWTVEDYRAALEGIGVDPTIIQPPPCDPFYQVCYRDVPPRNNA